jgi:hypothetical protein
MARRNRHIRHTLSLWSDWHGRHGGHGWQRDSHGDGGATVGAAANADAAAE